MRNNTYAKTGTILVILGVLVLIITRTFIARNMPVLNNLWPIIVIIGLGSVAVSVKGQVASLGLATMGLLAAVSYLNEGHIFRIVLGFGCIGVGLLLLYRMIIGNYIKT